MSYNKFLSLEDVGDVDNPELTEGGERPVDVSRPDSESDTANVDRAISYVEHKDSTDESEILKVKDYKRIMREMSEREAEEGDEGEDADADPDSDSGEESDDPEGTENPEESDEPEESEEEDDPEPEKDPKQARKEELKQEAQDETHEQMQETLEQTNEAMESLDLALEAYSKILKAQETGVVSNLGLESHMYELEDIAQRKGYNFSLESYSKFRHAGRYTQKVKALKELKVSMETFVGEVIFAVVAFIGKLIAFFGAIFLLDELTITTVSSHSNDSARSSACKALVDELTRSSQQAEKDAAIRSYESQVIKNIPDLVLDGVQNTRETIHDAVALTIQACESFALVAKTALKEKMNAVIETAKVFEDKSGAKIGRGSQYQPNQLEMVDIRSVVHGDRQKYISEVYKFTDTDANNLLGGHGKRTDDRDKMDKKAPRADGLRCMLRYGGLAGDYGFYLYYLPRDYNEGVLDYGKRTNNGRHFRLSINRPSDMIPNSEAGIPVPKFNEIGAFVKYFTDLNGIIGGLTKDFGEFKTSLEELRKYRDLLEKFSTEKANNSYTAEEFRILATCVKFHLNLLASLYGGGFREMNTHLTKLVKAIEKLIHDAEEKHKKVVTRLTELAAKSDSVRAQRAAAQLVNQSVAAPT